MQTLRTNLKINASTQYSNFNYKSMCMFNGVVIGAGPSGLFKSCCGDDDNGVNIDAYFIPHTTNMGSHHGKRVRKVYMGLRGNGDMSLTITGDGSKVNGPYTESLDSTENPQQVRFSIDRSKSWIYGSVKINNVGGSFFAIDFVEMINIQILKRRA